MAGLYALACQVKPDVTPEVFWRAAQDTGDTITYRQGLFTRQLGTIVNPVRLIEKLKSGS